MSTFSFRRPAAVLAAALTLFAPGAAEAGVIAITHAKIHSLGPVGSLENATLVIRDERIEAIGVDAVIPPEARLIDAQGAVITPGLFDAYTHLGLEEISGVIETRDDASGNPRYSAALDVTEGLNPRSTLIPVNRIEGITQAMSAPESGEAGPLLAGQGAVIQLGLSAQPERFVAKPRAAQFAQLGEAGMAQIRGGRPALMLALREAFEEVRGAGQASSIQRPALLGALDVEALKPVLAGDTPLVVRINRAADIRALLKLAEDYGIRLVIHGGAEAHLLAAELAAKNVPVILDPTEDLPSHFESLAARADAAAILQRAGVLIAISSASDQGSHNSRNIRQLAGNAVAHGLAWKAALAAITLNPARIYGLDSTMGSLEAGKLANFVIWDGDPLEVTSAATQVYAEGRAIPMTSRQTLLRERYRKR